MNRREAFQAIGAALVGTAAEGGKIQMPEHKPQMLVITIHKDIDIDIDSISEREVHRLRDQLQEACYRAGWGKDFPVVVLSPGLEASFEPKPSVNVTIPPDTIVEQFDDYTVIYPAGKPPVP